jgi:4-diphosphocytidyl-2-C-methyl-D-erythritol kinase
MHAILAPAKINLTLRVTGKREDGYHLLDSLTVFAQDVADKITVIPTDVIPGGEQLLTLSGPFAAGLQNEDMEQNLAFRALRAYERAIGASFPLHIHIEKNIPMGAGLGGGSSDAAAVIRLLEKTHGVLPETERNQLLLSLGADVPVCYYGKPCRFTGIGENIELFLLPPLFLLLVWPGVQSVTKDVFQAFSSSRPERSGAEGSGHVPLHGRTSFTEIEDYMRNNPNELTAAAVSLNPVIGRALEAVASLPACRLSRMSGSGSSVFGIFNSLEEAKAAEILLKNQYPDWWTAPTRAG